MKKQRIELEMMALMQWPRRRRWKGRGGYCEGCLEILDRDMMRDDQISDSTCGKPVLKHSSTMAARQTRCKRSKKEKQREIRG